MSLFNAVTMTLRRYSSPGGYVAGEYQQGAADPDTTFKGTFQPATGRDTSADIGGRRKSDSDRIFTSTRLYTTENKTGTPSDIVIYNGITYEVKKVGYWQNGIISHYEADVEEIKEGNPR